MPASEFAEAALYEQLEPFGDRRGDIQVAMLASVIANIYRDSRRRAQPYGINDFLLEWESRPPVRQTAAQQLEIMRAIQRAQNAAIEAAGKPVEN
jgi:hypothetical protein